MMCVIFYPGALIKSSNHGCIDSIYVFTTHVYIKGIKGKHLCENIIRDVSIALGFSL